MAPVFLRVSTLLVRNQMVLVSIYERASTAFNQFVNFMFLLSNNDDVFKIFAGFFCGVWTNCNPPPPKKIVFFIVI